MNNQNRNLQNRQAGQGKAPSFDRTRIVLSGKLPRGLFSQVAEDAAKDVAEWDGVKHGKTASRPTQLRKFYDEICMWDSKCQIDPERFDEYLPFILMLKAKVAYARGRKHVNKEYVDILNRCLSELEQNPDPKTLHNLKFFVEAFTGFYKVYVPNN